MTFFLLSQPQLTAPEDVKASMEQSDHREGEGEVVSAADPQVGSGVSAAPEGSEQVIVANGSKLLTKSIGADTRESDGEAEEQDSTQELDSMRSENGDRTEVSADSQAFQSDTNTSCDSGTSSMDDARTPTGAPDASPECSPPVIGERAESSPAVCLIQESSPAVLDGVAELSPVILDGIVECSGLLSESSPAILDGATTSSPAGLDTMTEGPSVEEGGSSAPPPTHTQMDMTVDPTPTQAQGEVTVANGPSAKAPGSPAIAGHQSPSVTPDCVTDTLGKISLPSPAPATPTPAANPNASSSPYDTDCSRRSMSEIQRTLSQESLLDELESELLSCQLTGEDRAHRTSPPNGMPKDSRSMAVFEKCVQYKYSQQEKAIKK